MDPIITTAVVAAIANLSKDAIRDSYNALKLVIKQKFGEESDFINSIDKLEDKPDSNARKAVLQEEVESAQADRDLELLKLAQDLLQKVKDQSSGGGTLNQTQTNTVSGVTVGGDFEFKPTQEGSQS